MSEPSAASTTPSGAAPGGRRGSALGILSIVFALLIPIVGLVLGIIAMNEGGKRGDARLRKQGIIGIVISVILIALAVVLFA